MAVSMKDIDVAFHDVGRKAGTEVWRIQNFRPVLLPQSEHGTFHEGDSYIVLRTTALKSGAFHFDVHFWLGKSTTQDEAGAAAIKTVELDAALGGRAVQYREVQGHESDLFLSYFKPCIIPLEGGFASGFRKKENDFQPHLYVCRGARVARVTEIPYARQSLNHDDVFILDTKDKIYQFNGSNTSIQERQKAQEVVQYLKDTNHDGKCAVNIVDDTKLGSEPDAGEIWELFGGFAPHGRKRVAHDDSKKQPFLIKLLCVGEGKPKEVRHGSALKKTLLESNSCYLLDVGSEIFVWMGRDSSLEQRKAATLSAEEFNSSQGRPSFIPVIRVTEGFEIPIFKSYFEKWPRTSQTVVSEDGRGKVGAMLKQQGVDVKSLLKGAPISEHTTLLGSSGKLEHKLASAECSVANMSPNPAPPVTRDRKNWEEETKLITISGTIMQARTFVIPPDLIAEAMSSLHGLDLRWSGPITSTEMRYVEQYVQARYPQYYEALVGNKPGDLHSLYEDQELSDDGSAAGTPTDKRSPSTARKDPAFFGSALPEPKKMPLEASKLLDILTKKSQENDDSISIPEMHARNRVLKHCSLYENEYLVVFTSNRKEAMRLVAESYPFFKYNFYMTVLEEEVDAIRDFAIYREAKILPVPSSWLDLRIPGSQISQSFRKKSKHSPKGLFAYPADMKGTRHSLHWVSEAQRNCWHVLLDATELILGEDQLNLTLHKPDFAVCSLPKVVGQTTRITCLLVRRSSFSAV